MGFRQFCRSDRQSLINPGADQFQPVRSKLFERVAQIRFRQPTRSLGPGERCGHLGSRQDRGAPNFATIDKTDRRRRVAFLYESLNDYAGVEIRRHSRLSRSSSETDPPSSVFTMRTSVGGSSPFQATTPARAKAKKMSRSVFAAGIKWATGRPRSVITSVSPCFTRWTCLLSVAFNSRNPISRGARRAVFALALMATLYANVDSLLFSSPDRYSAHARPQGCGSVDPLDGCAHRLRGHGNPDDPEALASERTPLSEAAWRRPDRRESVQKRAAAPPSALVKPYPHVRPLGHVNGVHEAHLVHRPRHHQRLRPDAVAEKAHPLEQAAAGHAAGGK